MKKLFKRFVQTMDNFEEFLQNNFLYFIWGGVYVLMTWFMLGATMNSFIITLCIYAISLMIAFSDIGEKILRFVNRVRELYTKRERYYLIPIFKEVYAEARKACPNLQGVKIYIIDAMYINAFALGKKTVAVTKGAVESLSEDELKGFIAHELGHIAHGDTKALLLTTVGNGIFMIFILAGQFAMNIINSVVDRHGISGFILGLMKFWLHTILFYFLYIGQFILAINSRKNEYAADKFAFEIGYGDDLVSALYLLQDMCISESAKLVDRLKASHPHIAKRIGMLESMIDKAEQA